MKQKLLYLFLFLTINTISFAQVANQPNDLEVCDEDNDGFALFDLTYADAQVLGAQSAIDFTITYHETQNNASNGTNAINGSYINIISWFQTLYVRLEANATGNFATTELTLVVINTSEFTAEIISNDVFFSDTDSDSETPVEANLCGFGSVTIETNSPLADGFIWYRNGFEMFGETSSSLVVTQSDVYQVAAFYNQCGSSVFSQLVVLNLYEEATVIDPQTIMACDNSSADGTADFNLDDLSASLGLGDEFVISYYTSTADANQAINSIVSPYISAGETLIVRVEDIDAAADSFLGCRYLSTVDLVVNSIPVAVFPTALSLCDDSTSDEIAVFDLTVKDAEITNGNADWSVSYYETNADAQAQTNVIANPTAYTNSSVNGNIANPQTLYVVVTDINTGCMSFTTLTIRVLPNPTPTPSELLSDLVLCDETNPGDEVEAFDLTENEVIIINGEAGQTVTYYISENDAMSGSNSISDPTQFINTVSPQTIFARTQSNFTGCFAVVNFNIMVNALPETVAVTDFIQCELNTDGFAEFDLISKDAEVLNGQDPSLLEVTYHETLEDAYSGANALASPYTNVTNPQQIFVTITNILTDCSISTQSFNLEVQEAAQANADNVPILYEVCDDNMETDGDPTNDSVQFDLVTLEFEVLDGQDSDDYSVTYYATQADAEFGINPLPTLYQNVINPQIIYARVDNTTENGSGNDAFTCYATTDVTLHVNPLPFLNIDDSYGFCTGESVTIDTGLNSSNYSFQWATDSGPILGETQASITVTQPGFYNVTVIALSGCGSVTTMINVEEVICADTDEDGVIDSDEDLNDNGDLEDDDTDDDGIPNYLDSDDDGDNVATIDEINIVLGRSNNTIHQFVDTDDDEIENYLDDDDDGDGILTIDEDYNNNGDPTDDDTNSNTIPDYLESSVALSLNEFNVTRFNMFPNPAKENVTIQLASSYFETGSVNIYNIQGKAILKYIKFEENSSILDISSLESGLYFVELTIGNTSTVQKLIVN
ncbi:T9SS type A sorting domain-containing protein [Winogradskyella psychrotolerans]|uniref:T9SS type A sorting domain-containing protein n=1 Tax=Winogradskyella psychrotolerans TaxID=1344585 RepID=UPI001C073449|nr:T9SS type A sorting domain-containing protein [Winogradskyella psychrotolerans]MBU2928947.1 T9SS type A sorting domain-containing protein [Winogradskyella psychrotolerans]